MKKGIAFLILAITGLSSCNYNYTNYISGIYNNRYTIQIGNIAEIINDYSLAKYSVNGYVSATFDGGYIITDKSGNIPLYTKIKLQKEIYYSFIAEAKLNEHKFKYLTNIQDVRSLKPISPIAEEPTILYEDDLDSYFYANYTSYDYSSLYGFYDVETNTFKQFNKAAKIKLLGDLNSIPNGLVNLCGYIIDINIESKTLDIVNTNAISIKKELLDTSYLGKKCYSRADAIKYMDSFLLNKHSKSSSMLIMYPYNGNINDEIDQIYRGLETIGGLSISIYKTEILDGYDFVSFQCKSLDNQYAIKKTENAKIIPNYNNANALAFPKFNKRDESFSSFKINSLKNSIVVNSSEELWYACEQGYLPVPELKSKAEIYFNKAKEILKSICSDEMNDYQKVSAIYYYLTQEINYDYDVSRKLDDWKLYKSYFLEGVFDEKLATNDGLSKAFVLLCSIEGIKSVRSKGLLMFNSDYYYHAWNYVLVDNTWTNVCTSSSRILGNIDGNEFAFTSSLGLFAPSNFLQENKLQKYLDFSHSDIKILAEKPLRPTIYEKEYFLDGSLTISLFERDKDYLTLILKKFVNSCPDKSSIEIVIFVDLSNMEILIAEAVKSANIDPDKLAKFSSGFNTYIFAKK